MQNKLHDQIKILKHAKNGFDSKNFREKIAVIGDKQKEIETKQSIKNKEFGIKLQEMKIEIDKMIKEFTSHNSENEKNKIEIQKMGKQIDEIVKEQVTQIYWYTYAQYQNDLRTKIEWKLAPRPSKTN